MTDTTRTDALCVSKGNDWTESEGDYIDLCEALERELAAKDAEIAALRAEVQTQRDCRLANEQELLRADEMLGALRAEVERFERCKNSVVEAMVQFPNVNEYVSQVEREVYQLRKAAEWQPIETAPKGKKLILGYHNSAGMWRTIIGQYYLPETLQCEDSDSGYADAGWYEDSQTHEEIYLTDVPPTHWQPLPQPPTDAAIDAAREHGK